MLFNNDNNQKERMTVHITIYEIICKTYNLTFLVITSFFLSNLASVSNNFSEIKNC